MKLKGELQRQDSDMRRCSLARL